MLARSRDLGLTSGNKGIACSGSTPLFLAGS